MQTTNSQFRPDYDQDHPGVFLNWILETRGIKKVDFAKRCGRPTKTISEIISGKTSITPETALQFEHVLGESAGYWLGLESNYQLQQARATERKATTNPDASNWAKQFPLNEMCKANFFPKPAKKEELVSTLLRFFSISSITAWDNFWQNRLSSALFKQHDHHEIDSYAVASWLRRGEVIAERIETAPYDEAAFRIALVKIRALTIKPWSEVQSSLVETCREVGVAVALVPGLSKTGLRGAAYWGHKDKAVIVLSDRGKYEEKVWFSFFHEAIHILHHSKKAVFIDQDKNGNADEEIEREADEFSADFLIPNQALSNFCNLYGVKASNLPANIIEDFAHSIGISAGLLLERLQYENIIRRNTALNTKLKRKLKFQ